MKRQPPSSTISCATTRIGPTPGNSAPAFPNCAVTKASKWSLASGSELRYSPDNSYVLFNASPLSFPGSAAARGNAEELSSIPSRAAGRANVPISAPGGLVAGRQQNQSVRTDSDGRFRLTGLTPNFHYYLTARKRGYFGDLAGGGGSPSTQVASASPAAPTPPVSFQLAVPRPIISGRVVDEYGEPVRGATVQAGRLLRLEASPSTKPPAPPPSPTTKANSASPACCHSCYLLVRYDDLDNLSAGPATTAGNYLPTYFPGTGNLLAAQPLTLTAGLELPGNEFKLKRERVFNISGRVSGVRAGQPLMPSVELLPQDPLFAALRLPQRGGMMRPNSK